jgi:hypothetical protein
VRSQSLANLRSIPAKKQFKTKLHAKTETKLENFIY